MYVLNKRQINITGFLLEQNVFVAAKTISEKFNVSVRTIRYDIELIEDWLNLNNAALVRVPKMGIMVKTNLHKDVLLEKLKFVSLENRILSEKERVTYIVLELLSDETGLSIAEISTRLYLSRNTIMKVIKKTREYLAENDLELVKVNAKGFIISGDEVKKREMLLKIFLELLDVNNIILAMNDEVVYKDFIEYCENNYPRFKFQNIKMIYAEIVKIEDEFDFHLTDTELARFTIYLIIMLTRNERNEYITYKDTEIHNLEEYDIAVKMAGQLGRAFDVSFLAEEIDGIANFLVQAKSFYADSNIPVEEINLRFNFKILDIAKHIIDYSQNELKVSLVNDNKLYADLVLHLKSAIGRYRNKKDIKGMYTDEIKSKFPLVFQIVKESLYSHKNKVRFNDDEVAYITLHIRAAYERNYHENYKSCVLVVCQEGVSLLSILVTKLQRNFPDLKLIETCSVYDYEAHKKKIDLIITTNSFKTRDADVIKVSPFLEDDDIGRITAKLAKLNKFKQIYKYDQIMDMKEGRIILLEHLLSVDMIELGVNADDWEDAIRKASSPLLRFNKITGAYIDNMIQAVKELGPYIVIMPGIAFAHARPDESVRETCMSMITLSEPVNFGSKQNDPVSIVFAFGAQNGDDHLKALQDLAKFLMSEENIRFLKEGSNKKTILNKLLNI